MPKGIFHRTRTPLIQRLARIVVDPISGCWLWTGALDQGYAVLSIDGKKQYAHRVSYEMFVGPVPDGLELDHTCHSPLICAGGECIHRRCINPDHLEAVTTAVNTSRGCLDRRQHQLSKTHCPAGHEYSGRNLKVKPNGWRRCRECGKLQMRALRLRRRTA